MSLAGEKKDAELLLPMESLRNLGNVATARGHIVNVWKGDELGR